jgi:hypothetical protein
MRKTVGVGIYVGNSGGAAGMTGRTFILLGLGYGTSRSDAKPPQILAPRQCADLQTLRPNAMRPRISAPDPPFARSAKNTATKGIEFLHSS